MERHATEMEALLRHTKKMPPMKVGNSVRIQNQTGNAPRRWDKSGHVVEVRENDQYAIKIHGSGRVTHRNRQFLRLYVPHTEKPCPRRITDDTPNRSADIRMLPLSLFPMEDLTQEICTPLVSDARRSPTTPAMLRTPPRTARDCKGELNPRSLSFRPDTEDADTEDLIETACQENTVPGCAATDDDNVATIRRPSIHHVPTGHAKVADMHADPLQGLPGRQKLNNFKEQFVRPPPACHKNSGRGRTLTITRHSIITAAVAEWLARRTR